MSKKENQSKPFNPEPSRWRSTWIYFVVAMLLFSMLYVFDLQKPVQTSWSEFEQDILSKNMVDRVEVVNKERANVYLKAEVLDKGELAEEVPNNSGPHYTFTIGSVEVFENRMAAAAEQYQLNPVVDISYSESSNWLMILLSWLLPFALIIAFWMYISRRSTMQQMGGRSPFDFSKSNPVLFDKDETQAVTFDDVAGLESAKLEVKEIIDFLKTPDVYTRLGAKIPKGVLLMGPPGSGKTLLARAVAGEAKVPFYSISGSEFVEMFVGVGASRVRDLFKKASEKAPSIIFIDEIDAIGRHRGAGRAFNSNDERESTLNQLLTEMDGFDSNNGVIVMAATNRPDILDKALLRPGRFDRHIQLDLPSLEERKAIFKVHLRKIKLAEAFDLEVLASQTPGFSGADIANICNEAALIAARYKKDQVEQQDFTEAIDRIIGGLERKGKILSDQEKQRIAIHEAGHATVGWHLEHTDELFKVTIIPRGKSLGAAWYLPEEHNLLTRAQLFDRLCMALGGRAAEELIYNDASNGALDDLEKVTKQAYSMVAYFGLSEELGPLSFYDSDGSYDRLMQKPYSEEMGKLIDRETQKLVWEAYDQAQAILTDHQGELEKLAALLLEKETVEQDDLKKIFGPVKRSTTNHTNSGSVSSKGLPILDI